MESEKPLMGSKRPLMRCERPVMKSEKSLMIWGKGGCMEKQIDECNQEIRKLPIGVL